ncbi:PREDICTED: uncharacterized protein LOC105563327 [Vollenhovia emeryi]|uniref:uncharacterized protein LOC105563327 n=1 Tax=Vollenhovia emeryi TaxID=411798 RepID=UPI0005F36D48|nr:PREDICTED: uncharacterized protein LOC105563327 [Vollenhovia emeryi]
MPTARTLLTVSHGSVAIMESVTEWPYDKVLQLIALFQQRPLLWDSQCEAYKDRQKRHEATLELAAHFNVERDEIERKLKNLQSHFYREVKKEVQTKSSAGTGTTGIYRSKWFAYNAMRFLAEYKSKPRRSHIQVGGKVPATRQKTAVRVPILRHNDKSRLKKSEHEPRNSSLRRSSAIKNENSASAVNDFLYIDANQQNNMDNSQMEYWEEKPVSTGSQDPIEFAIGLQTNEVQQQQSQQVVNFEDNRPNEKELSTPCKQDAKTLMSKDTIAPTIDFLLAELKAHGSNDPELIFYRSLIPDIMKLSDKRRRQFKEVVLCTLNKLLDEDESACTVKT